MTANHTYDDDQIRAIVKEYLVKEFMYDRPEIVLTDEYALIEQGVVDSMGIIRLLTFIQEQFGIEVEPQELVLENFATILAIGGLVRSKLG